MTTQSNLVSTAEIAADETMVSAAGPQEEEGGAELMAILIPCPGTCCWSTGVSFPFSFGVRGLR